MIELDQVTKRFGHGDDAVTAVDDLSFTVAEGEVVALVGSSGSGKTTTLRMINRLIEPTEGRLTVAGREVTTVPVHELRRDIGYVIQQGGLFPHRTVAQNVATVPKLIGWDKRRMADRVDELLTLVGLDADMGSRFPAQLSGGQQQRVGVARALAADPPVLLMDEPFGAVDPIVRAQLQREFAGLQRDLGKTVVFVTHDVDEAIALGDRIAVLEPGGRLAQMGTPAELMESPASSFVTNFLGDRQLDVGSDGRPVGYSIHARFDALEADRADGPDRSPADHEPARPVGEPVTSS
ncbi:MAG: ABC transporter ATP-binding protein [Desertimonas sp.]